MSLPFSEETFVRIVSSNIFDNCVSKHGDFEYGHLSKLASEEQDIETQEVLRTIINFCSMYMNEESTEPFGPMYTFSNKRSFLPEDISVELAEFLYKNADRITNIAIKARIYDSIWLIKRLDNKSNIVCAQKAVNNYYSLINNFIATNNLHAAIRYIERVYHLASSIRGTQENRDLFKTLLKYADIDYDFTNEFSCLYWQRILEKIIKFPIEDSAAYKYYNKTLDIIKILLKQDFYIFPESCFYGSEDMQKLSSNPPNQNAFIWLRKFYDIAIIFAQQIDQTNIDNLKTSKAKTFEYEAQLRPQMNFFSYLLKNAINIYRSTPNHREDIIRLTKSIEQNTCAMPYATFSHTTDITDLVKVAQQSVTNKDFPNSIFSLTMLFDVFFGESLDKNKAYERAIETEKLSPLLSLMTQVILDEQGHEIASASTQEEILQLSMMRTLWIENEMSYVPIIEAINIINMEHHYNYTDILSLMTHTAFVPDQHKIIIAKGIYAFLKGDMIDAAHFLVIQFEDCLRHLLEPLEPTMKIINSYEEKNINIDFLLKKCVEKNIFPEGLAWFFYCYLVAKNKNLRNLIAHGMLSDKHYHSYEVGIICYGIIYLVLFHDAAVYFKKSE